VHSSASNSSAPRDETLALDLNLPDFDVQQAEHWPSSASWTEAMRALASSRDAYMQRHDSPEQRWRDKNPQPFRL
jgi:hypothetical protein